MQEDFKLRGDSYPVELEQSGLTLVAPGLAGSAVCYLQRAVGETRAFSGEQRALDQAIAEAALDDRYTLVIDAPTPPAAPGQVRGAGEVADDEMLLQVPLAADETSFVIYADEAGVLSVHYGLADQQQTALPTRAFGAARQMRFRLPLRAGKSQAAAQSRGLIGTLTSKIIKVIVVRLFPDRVGSATARAVAAWEQKHRAFRGLHGGSWQQLLGEVPVGVDDLSRLRDQRCLLFIHGTTSSTAGAFGALSAFPALLERLYAAYQGRVFGFNHPTLATGVAGNVRDFYAALAACPGAYHFDVVCHSRGGLVARALSQLSDAAVAAMTGSPWQRPADVRLAIGRIVFVATPNAGTELAYPQQIAQFVERLINVVDKLPDSLATVSAGALLSIAASVAQVTLPRLPGLADQAPNSTLIAALPVPPEALAAYYAFQASYQPSGDLAAALKDAVADRLFGDKANDLVVPSDGVSTTPAFAIPAARVVAWGAADGVHHTNFFAQPGIARLADFLGVP